MTEITFTYWEFDERSMTRKIAAICDIDPPMAKTAVRQALAEYWAYGQITFRPNGAGDVAWTAEDEATEISLEPRLRAAPRGNRQPAARIEAHQSPAWSQPVHERLLTISARLIPRAERARFVRTWLDHLQCERETDNHPRLTALEIVLTGVLPIAFNARLEIVATRLHRLTRR